MNLSILGNTLRRGTKEHLPVIMSVAAGVGTIATSILVGKASFQACDAIRAREEHMPPSIHSKERLMERTKLVWKFYIPAAISASSTIAFIVGANRAEFKKTLAAQTAFAVSERVYSEYRDKVIEEYGERKDQAIRDKIVDEHVKKTAPGPDILVAGTGNVLCCELYTGRYFMSDMETLRKSENELNARLLAHDYATFDDFYDMIGLTRTTNSGNLGWRSTKLMKLEFSTSLTEDGRPCLAFEYNYAEPL